MTITVDAGALMRDVIDEAAKEGLSLPHMIYWDGVSAGGVISTGAHGSGLFGRGSAVHEYVVALRLVIPAPPSEGYAKVVTLSEGDPDFKAAAFSLGTLGAISQVTFALQPMFKRSVSYSLEDDDDLEFRVEDFVRAFEFGEIFWYPAHRKALFGRIQRVSIDTSGNGVNKFLPFQPIRVVDVQKRALTTISIQDHEDADRLCKINGESINSRVATGSGYLNDGKRFTGYPVVGFNHLMQTSGGCQDYSHKSEYNPSCTPTKILDANQSICEWDRRVGATLIFDMEIRIPLSLIEAAIVDLKRIRDLNPKAMCEIDGVSITVRSIKKSEAYLGLAEDMVTLEFIYYRPRQPHTPKWNEDVYEEMEQLLIEKYGGTLHWGKSGGFLFQGLAKRSVSLEKFLDVKKRFDSDGLFSNDWTDGLLGIGGKSVEELRDGCALDKTCKCRVDSHCAPHKGYFCKSGRLWMRARVCRKQT